MAKQQKVECRIIRPIIQIMVGDDVTPEQCKTLYEKLSDGWDDTMDDDDGLYKAMVRWLEAAGVSGDFTVEEPESNFYDPGRRQIC